MSAATRTIRMLRRSGGIAEIRLDRPESRNALSVAMLAELGTAVHNVANGPAVRALVISSSDERFFCVGVDLKERAGLSDEELVAQRPVLTGAFAALRAIPFPVIVAVSGYAVGGGLEMALSADVIIAAEDAILGLPEVSRGLIPGGGGTQLLQRRAGPGVAAELIYSGRLVDAGEAERRGIVDRLVPLGRARAEALALAAAIARHSPLAVRSAKRSIVLGAGTTLERGLEIEEVPPGGG